MRENDLDALLVYGDSSSAGANLAACVYLTGYEDPWFSYVVVLPGEEPLLLNSNPLYLPPCRSPMEFEVLNAGASSEDVVEIENRSDEGGGLPGENGELPVDRGGKK